MRKSSIVFTIGHSTMPLEDFIAILKANSVETVADVRTVPRSRHNPQFNRETLPGELKKAELDYSHWSALGGLRHARPDSVNMGWLNASFRGFADYMQTGEFAKVIEELVKSARLKCTAVMCAEALPWRCHRSLIADALTVRGMKVQHLMGKGKPLEHHMTPWAHINGLEITYPQQENPK
jgi:uncharacterized protein (DUF488 family)